MAGAAPPLPSRASLWLRGDEAALASIRRQQEHRDNNATTLAQPVILATRSRRCPWWPGPSPQKPIALRYRKSERATRSNQ